MIVLNLIPLCIKPSYVHCRWTNESDGKKYRAQVAFQVFISPEAYKVGPQTVAATKQIDPKFTNDEIEWFTNQQGSTILYGLLIKVIPVG